MAESESTGLSPLLEECPSARGASTTTPMERTGCTCGFVTDQLEELLEHVAQHEDGQQLDNGTDDLSETGTKEEDDGTASANSQDALSCDICHQLLSSRANLERHRRRHLATSKVFKCPVCDRTFGRNDQRRDHVIRHIRKQNYLLCPCCAETFNQYNVLCEHVEAHGAEDRKCRLCETTAYHKPGSLVAHFYTEHYSIIQIFLPTAFEMKEDGARMNNLPEAEDNNNKKNGEEENAVLVQVEEL